MLSFLIKNSVPTMPHFFQGTSPELCRLFLCNNHCSSVFRQQILIRLSKQILLFYLFVMWKQTYTSLLTVAPSHAVSSFRF